MKNNISTLPRVSVIIVNWNGGEVFENCLKSLRNLTYPNWEMIVVDNGSSDGSEKLPIKYKLGTKKYELIRNKRNRGFAPANNQALQYAKGEYLLLLNNDTKVTSSFLTKMVLRMQRDHSLGVLQPKMYMMTPPSPKATEGLASVSTKDGNGHEKLKYLDNAGSFMTRIGFLSHWGFGEKDGDEFMMEREVFSAKGACMLIRKEVVDRVGLFDDDFNSYFEESDFCWRVWLAGWKVLFFPDAHIEHKVGFTIQRLDVTKINFDYYKNRIMSLIKNFGTFNLLTILPVHLLISSGIAVAFLMRGQSKSSLMIIKAIVWNVRHVNETLVKRRKVQSLRKSKDKELFGNLMHKVDIGKFFGDFKRVENDMK